MKAQAALDLQQMQQKFTSLAQAIPRKIQLAPRSGIALDRGDVFAHGRSGIWLSKDGGTLLRLRFDGKGFDKKHDRQNEDHRSG